MWYLVSYKINNTLKNSNEVKILFLFQIKLFQICTFYIHCYIPVIFKTCNTWLFCWGTDLFSLGLSNWNKMTTANITKAVQFEWVKLYLFSGKIVKKYIYVCHRDLEISLCVPWGEKGWTLLLYYITLLSDKTL